MKFFHTMSKSLSAVLIACGSYNPITNMHLRMMEIAKDSLESVGNVNVTQGILSPVSDSYGKKDLVPAADRCEMVKLALQTSDWMKLDTWECDKLEWTPTCRVLDHFEDALCWKSSADPILPKRRKTDSEESSSLSDSVLLNCAELSKQGPFQIKFVCGADVLESFSVPGLWDPNDIERIVGHYGIVVISRADTNPEKFIYETDVLHKNKKNIHIVTEWIQNDISATKIRRAIRRHESVRYLVQDSVIEYIRSKQLYKRRSRQRKKHMDTKTTPKSRASEPCLMSPRAKLTATISRSTCMTPPPVRNTQGTQTVRTKADKKLSVGQSPSSTPTVGRKRSWNRKHVTIEQDALNEKDTDYKAEALAAPVLGCDLRYETTDHSKECQNTSSSREKLLDVSPVALKDGGSDSNVSASAGDSSSNKNRLIYSKGVFSDLIKVNTYPPKRLTGRDMQFLADRMKAVRLALTETTV